MPLEKQYNFEDSWLWQFKLKLQFTGWLQYAIHGLWVIGLLLLSAIGYWVGSWLDCDVSSGLMGVSIGRLVLFWLPFTLTVILFVWLVFTIITVKYGIHPVESLPHDNRHLDVFTLMNLRRSCRSFQKRHLTEVHRLELMQVVAHHSQPSKLLGNKAIRFEYVASKLTVWPVVGAQEFLVAIAPKDYDRVAVIDIGRSLQKVVIHATRMGLATCWIGPGADQDSIIRHLGERFDSERDHVICVCAIGYESAYQPLFIRVMRRLQHKRLPLSELFFADPALTQPLDTNAVPFLEYQPCYTACQWSPSSYNSQPTRCVAVTKQDAANVFIKRFDFYIATTSRYYAPVALGIWCANWEMGCDALNKAGRWQVLTPNELIQAGSPVSSEPPCYGASWVVESKEQS